MSEERVTADLGNPRATQSLLAIIVTVGSVVTIAAATVSAIIKGADPTTFVALGASLAQTALGYYFLDKANATPAA